MNFLLTADWHLRGDLPRCRNDEDWVETQRSHIRFLVNTANTSGVPLVIVGDIFNTPRVATHVVNASIAELIRAESVLILAGNHDLPYHSYDNVENCSFGTIRNLFAELGTARAKSSIGDHNANPFGNDVLAHPAEVVFTHQLCFEDDNDRPMAECGKIAADLLAEFPNAKWIFTGDYHTAFHYIDGDRHVVNPGCMNRQVADKMNYQCKAALINTGTGEVKWIDIPDSQDLVSDSYLRAAEGTEDRVEAFLELVQNRGSVSLSFTDNLEKAIADPIIEQDVRNECLSVLQTINDSI